MIDLATFDWPIVEKPEEIRVPVRKLRRQLLDYQGMMGAGAKERNSLSYPLATGSLPKLTNLFSMTRLLSIAPSGLFQSQSQSMNY